MEKRKHNTFACSSMAEWPSGLSRSFKTPVISMARVQIPFLSKRLSLISY